ncbi:MAG TPA: phosphopantetheine-binding protein [Candidatus Polarisedimenticolia bacterium]|nr:phosphopantetheine-binding protein [Candidatus Polarisedimenticolia bacterium]
MDTEVRYDRQTITDDVLAILNDMTGDWDTGFSGAIGPDTRLVADLAFESIDVVQLIVALEERYQRRDLPFEQLLMADGRYVDEIRVREAVDFLHRHLNPDGAGA